MEGDVDDGLLVAVPPKWPSPLYLALLALEVHCVMPMFISLSSLLLGCGVASVFNRQV